MINIHVDGVGHALNRKEQLPRLAETNRSTR